MLAASPSTRTYSPSLLKQDSTFSPQCDNRARATPSQLPLIRPEPSRRFQLSPVPRPVRRLSARSLDGFSPPVKARRKMVDASTQYSPPNGPATPKSYTKTPTSTIAGLKLVEDEQAPEGHVQVTGRVGARPPEATATDVENARRPESSAGSAQTKRQAVDSADDTAPGSRNSSDELRSHDSPLKRARPDAPAVRVMPKLYETCDTRDLVILISSMLMELIRYNDTIPLRDGHLTRFHSRAPPGISVLDYLQRLTTHATLPPPILLSMVYYIDKLCTLYPAFTISSLTVHRFLITSATVASKGLSDLFWTNKTYAKVGGVSIKELALLELEFLTRVDWRIVPKPEVLCDYYKSLVKRSSEYRLEE